MVRATISERRTFANVWDALEDAPGETANLAMRSDVLIELANRADIPVHLRIGKAA